MPPSGNGGNCWEKPELCDCSGKYECSRLFGREFLGADGRSPQMLEPWFIVGDRLAECGKASCQQFDTIQLGARFFKRSLELVFHPIKCSVLHHSSPNAVHRTKPVRG